MDIEKFFENKRNSNNTINIILLKKVIMIQTNYLMQSYQNKTEENIFTY